MSGGTIQGIGNKEIYIPIFQDEGDQNFKKKKDITLLDYEKGISCFNLVFSNSKISFKGNLGKYVPSWEKI